VTQHTKSEGLNESIGPGVDANELAKKMDQLGTGVSFVYDLQSYVLI
jgi:hypothetical protein